MACTLCLIRHGETSWNVERRLQGHLDVPLNEAGRRQACLSAAALAGQSFSALYCSDLGRAHETARWIAEALGLDPVPLESLRERHYGAFQGLTYDEARTRFPEDYARFAAREITTALPGGGESLAAFATRIRRALEALTQRHHGERILVVTHGGVLDIAHRMARPMHLDAPRDFEIPNAALNWIRGSGSGWQLLGWADRTHLAAALDELR
ncbi:MAG: phosphoglycerate mutase family protein [Rhodocyclaceae bacterium]|nr:histidine phosphatase family protein [Rhodocyclaceae bacterium]MCL4756938.1 phosphoglycerate mutase family protein [Rhodocyclaceae bacterium]